MKQKKRREIKKRNRYVYKNKNQHDHETISFLIQTYMQ